VHGPSTELGWGLGWGPSTLLGQDLANLKHDVVPKLLGPEAFDLVLDLGESGLEALAVVFGCDALGLEGSVFGLKRLDHAEQVLAVLGLLSAPGGGLVALAHELLGIFAFGRLPR